jgi:hypothetical protein
LSHDSTETVATHTHLRLHILELYFLLLAARIDSDYVIVFRAISL